MLLEARNLSKTFSLRAGLIARFEWSGLHELWYRVAAKFRRRDAA
jgi:ABC-type antimicrobial peptide transport system ATPase subunit